MSGVSDIYLRAAHEAGLTAEVAGHRYIAGEYSDPITGSNRCLVEYCDPAGIQSEVFPERLWHAVVERFPTVEAVMVRTSAGAALPPPWRVHTTYLRYQGSDAEVSLSGVTVRDGEPEDRADVTDWLTRAFLDGAEQHGEPARAESAQAVAADVLDTPGTKSFVACRGSTVVGHATVLPDSFDEVTATGFVELLDILVDPDPDAGMIRHALAATSAAFASRLGLPLIGHVVHGASRETRAVAAGIVASLETKGWCQDHVFWIRRGILEGEIE
jgi:hypothetical protein